MSYRIRPVKPEEYVVLGNMVVDAYAGLPGMPAPDEQPEYYNKLRDVGARVANPAIHVYVAVTEADELLGSVDFIDDMTHYGSGGTAGGIPNAAGIRLLAVNPARRGMGIGKALTQYCIEQARGLGRAYAILHTTMAMQTAWGMYERMGFVRFPDIDFQQGRLEVFGFRLDLTASR